MDEGPAKLAVETEQVLTVAATTLQQVVQLSGFDSGKVTVSEGDSFVRLTVNNPAFGNKASLRVAIEPGSAVSGQDFLAPLDELLVFQPEDKAHDILLPLVADSIQEQIEEFTVRLAGDQRELEIDRQEVVVVIIDDDGPESG